MTKNTKKDTTAPISTTGPGRTKTRLALTTKQAARLIERQAKEISDLRARALSMTMLVARAAEDYNGEDTYPVPTLAIFDGLGHTRELLHDGPISGGEIRGSSVVADVRIGSILLEKTGQQDKDPEKVDYCLVTHLGLVPLAHQVDPLGRISIQLPSGKWIRA